MKLEHRFTVPATVDRTWAAFNDVERVVPCFPGATLTSSDGERFEGTCKVKLGPVSLLDAATDVEVDTDLTVTGKPAQFGRGLIQDVSDKLLAQFVDCLGERLGADTAAQPAGPESPQPDVSHATSAAGEPEPTSGPPGPSPSSSQAAELDLGSALLPVLARRLAPYLIGAVVALLLRRVLSRLFGR